MENNINNIPFSINKPEPYIVEQSIYIYKITFCDKLYDNKLLILVILLYLIAIVFYIYSLTY